MTVISVKIGAFGTVHKGLEKDWKNWKLEEEP